MASRRTQTQTKYTAETDIMLQGLTIVLSGGRRQLRCTHKGQTRRLPRLPVRPLERKVGRLQLTAGLSHSAAVPGRPSASPGR
jgi:hypothetical protein